jgi:L-ascorbate metabolism protein UlaG (beta-lactamase superfamily)
MRLTKYGHACIVLEEQGKKIVIDPGEFTPEFGDLKDIIAVVVTHVHGDHLSSEHLEAIVKANPDVSVFTTAEAAKEWDGRQAKIVKAGQTEVVGPFTMNFYGELHNAVHKDWPQNQNIGVMVNGTFYYPGDSFTLPNRSVKVLAVPAGAPWLKTGEAIDFIREIKPGRFFRSHDGLWNKNGLTTIDSWFGKASEKFGPDYTALEPGQSIEI